MFNTSERHALLALPLLLLLVLAPVLGAEAEGAAKKKKANKDHTTSAQTKALAEKLKKGKAALDDAKKEVAATLTPIKPAREARDRADKDVSDAKRTIREIEKEFDGYIQPDSRYAIAAKEARQAADAYDKAKQEAEAAAKAKQFKQESERFAFVQNYAPLVQAKAKRTATSRLASELREKALSESESWTAAKSALKASEETLSKAEDQLKSLVAENARARAKQADIEDAIADIVRAGQVSTVQDNQRAAIIAQRNAEIKRREQAERIRRQKANQKKKRR